MNPTFSIGRVAGVNVGLNWSWLIVFALVVWSLASAVFPSQNPGLATGTYVGMGAAAAILFFASLLLHELGHAVQARREGVEIEGITLWLFGGVARFKGMFPAAGAEFRIAIAGPLVTLLLGGGFIGFAALTQFSQPVDGVAAWLGYINLLLLGFNLLPALPLDGGRVLRSALWRARGDLEWATAVAADIGRGFGALMIGGGLLLFIFQGAFSGAWFAFIGWFLLKAAGAEAQSIAAREALAGLHVRDLMVRRPITARPDETIAEFMDEIAGTARHTAYPVVGNGDVLGVLTSACLAHTPRDEWAHRRIGDCMLPRTELPVLTGDEDLFDALTTLGRPGLHRGVVLENSHLVGLLSISDIGWLLTERPRKPTGRAA